MTTAMRQNADMLMEQAVAWFVRQDDGDLSTTEKAEFEAWRTVPAHAAALARVERLWSDFGDVPQEERPRPVAPLPAPVPLRARRPWQAAAMALAACLAVILSFSLDLPTRLRADMRTAVGEMWTHTLADGSVVILNSGSAVAMDLTANRRAIRLLRGEALFTVAPDPSRPFVVEAEGGSARALGTRFAVRNDKAGGTVTVLESHVRVSCCADRDESTDDHGATLAPGQRVSYSATGLGAVHDVDAEGETAWTRGKLIFTDRPLGQVVAELNRYFPGRIVVKGAALRERTVSGVFTTTDPLAAVDGLEQSLDLASTRFGPWLIVLHDRALPGT